MIPIPIAFIVIVILLLVYEKFAINVVIGNSIEKFNQKRGCGWQSNGLSRRQEPFQLNHDAGDI